MLNLAQGLCIYLFYIHIWKQKNSIILFYSIYFYLYLYKKNAPSEGHDTTCTRMVHHDADLVCNSELCSPSGLFQVSGMCIFSFILVCQQRN